MKSESGEVTMTMVAIVLAAVLMFMIPLINSADQADDVSQILAQTVVSDAVQQIISKGTLTMDDYQELYDSLMSTGNSFEIEITVRILDENSSKKTTQTSPIKIGENYSYTEYTSQIMDVLNSTGVYKLKEGDIIIITVRNTNKTISQILRNFMFKVTGNGDWVIMAQDSGMCM